MIIINFTDPHFTGKNLIDKPLVDFLSSRISKDDLLILNGDIFDTFDISTKKNLFYDYISSIPNKIIIVLGNHDFSKNRCWSHILKPFTDRIKIIEDYEFIDINENYRLHFKNYFRNSELKFDLKENVNNILFSHMDLDVDNPNILLTKFDLVSNGHIHNHQQKYNIMNLGAMRKCAKNEDDNKKYLIIDLDNKDMNYKLYDFKSVIDIKEVFVKDLRDVKIDRNTILRVLINSYQDEDDLTKKIEALEWYDKEKVSIEFVNYIDKEYISKIETEVLEDGSLNLINLFETYCDNYIEKFKDASLNKLLLQEKFKYFYEKEYEQLKNLFNIYNIKFKTLEASNFKLFKNFILNFEKFKSGIISIEGRNKDEIKNDNISSNEAGKSNIRDMLNYAFLGEGKPLRWTTKSGNVKLNLIINKIDIIIERKITKSGNELRLWFDGIEQWENETNTNKELLFFEKFKIKNSLLYIFLSDTGLGKYFFSSRNSEKFRIFKEIFPIIDSVGNFVQTIKISVDEKEKDFEKINLNKINLSQLRNNTNFKRTYYSIKDDFKKLKIDEINNKIKLIVLDNYILENKNNIIYGKEQINEKLLKSYNDIFKKFGFVKKIFEQQELFSKKYELIEKENIKIEGYQNNLNNSLEELKVIDNKINEIKENEIVEEDLNLIKNKLLKIETFNKVITKYSKELLISYKNIDIELEQKLLNEKNSLFNKIENFKNRIIELQEELKNIEFIRCPNCSFEIKDENRINNINEQIVELKKQGKDLLDIYNKVKKEYEELNIKNNDIKEKRKDIELILDNISVSELYKYLENQLDFDVDKKYNLNNIEDFIKQKEERNKKIILKNEYLKQKNNIEENINKIKNDINNSNLIIKQCNDNKIDFDLNNYNSIIKELNVLSLTKLEYILIEENINKILNIDILKDFDLEKLNNIYNKLKEQIILKEEYDKLNKELEFELKTKNSLIEKFDKFKKEFYDYKKDSDLKKKELNVEFIKIEKEYKDLKFLYDVMTAKRTFNFEKFFINTFFEKFSGIFNIMLKVLFNRDVSLYITESNFYFKDMSQDELNFDIFSNGAKNKIQIALILTITILFVNYGINSDVMIIDELLDTGLDEINLSRVMELIKHFFGERKKNFIISHKSIEDFIDDTIKIERYNGESKLL
jgi:hypothetical protein